MKRIVVEVNERLHKELKKYVIDKNTTIKDYILDLIEKDMKKRDTSPSK